MPKLHHFHYRGFEEMVLNEYLYTQLYLDPQSAITIGMIPDLPVETFMPLGNTSLSGASKALLSIHARDEIYKIRDRITYIELNVNQEFMNLFSAAKFIPHTDRSLFPSVRES
ncbi:MAG: ASKHA domain-containing protein [Cyanobacteriota bacterium]|nr:ASKHA domain-containing protein [Cyanobacteriota bacterium]